MFGLKNEKIIGIRIITVFCGLLFIFSGISKLFPIYAFEFLFVRENILSWALAPFAARLIIAFELFLGVHLCLGRDIKRIYIPAAALLLIGFSSYLAFTLMTKGAGANCGCFGELFPMSTSSALIKNIVLLALLFTAYNNTGEKGRFNFRLPVLTAILITGLIFTVFPVKPYIVPVQEQKPIAAAPADDTAKTNNAGTAEPKTAKERKPDTLKAREQKENAFLKKYPPVKSAFAGFTNYTGKTYNPDSGEKIIALFSLDCEHCMAVSKQLSGLRKKFRLPQVLILFLGNQDQVTSFFGGEDGFPYQILEPARFFPMLKKSPPRIVYLVNGNISGDWDESGYSSDALTAKIKEIRGGM